MGSKDWMDSKVKDERVQIIILASIGFGIVVGLYNGAVTEHIPDFLRLAIHGIEAGILRRRCIGIWLAISYFFMSWWPHATAHQYLNPMEPTDFIILEVCIHWPNLVAALVLCYYQFDVLLISHDVAQHNKELRNWTEADENPIPWYKNIKIHAVVIAVLCSVGWAIFQWEYNPYPPFVEQWQKGFFITIYITDGSSSGIACGFVYAAARLTHRFPKKRTRFIAALSTVCIGFILIVATPHPVAHHKYAMDPNGTIFVEYFFHLSITGAVAILGYYQHRFLVLSIKGRTGMMMRFTRAKLSETCTTENSVELQSRSKEKSSDSVNSSSLVEDADITVTVNS